MLGRAHGRRPDSRGTLPLALIAHVSALLTAPAIATAGYDPVIPPGATVAGLDVGGLPLSAAAERVEDEFGDRLRRRVQVRAAGHRRNLTARLARLEFDPLRSARRANIAVRRQGGPADVRPWVRYDERRVRRFVRRINRAVHRPARDARLRFTVTRLSVRPGRTGHRIRTAAVRRRVELALADPRAPRVLRAKRRTVQPDVTRERVAERHPTVVTIHRRGFRLRLFKRLEQVASYRVAVGKPGYATPRGRYRISSKAVDPAWSAPDRPWAGAYRNEVVAGGSPENPLKARWLGIAGGVGIHGTDATHSLGTRASHGCVRMSVPEIKRLYDRTPVGTLVMIR